MIFFFRYLLGVPIELLKKKKSNFILLHVGSQHSEASNPCFLDNIIPIAGTPVDSVSVTMQSMLML